NDAAGFASCCRPLSCSPRRALDAGLRPGPFPDRAASLLPGPPGSYPDGTHTRWRRRACVGSGHPINHLQRWAHEEEHVEAAQRERLDGKEVAVEHGRGLLAKKLSPAWTRTPRRLTVLGDRRRPSFSSSPAIRGSPQHGFSRAKRSTSFCTRASV